MGVYGFPSVISRARAVTVGVVVAMLLPLVAVVAPTAQAAAPATTVVSLTFDDSTSDQMVAASALQASGLHGTFYAITDGKPKTPILHPLFMTRRQRGSRLLSTP